MTVAPADSTHLLDGLRKAGMRVLLQFVQRWSGTKAIVSLWSEAV
jgi:hypothetical protein